jgi:hypothetical protein
MIRDGMLVYEFLERRTDMYSPHSSIRITRKNSSKQRFTLTAEEQRGLMPLVNAVNVLKNLGLHVNDINCGTYLNSKWCKTMAKGLLELLESRGFYWTADIKGDDFKELKKFKDLLVELMPNKSKKSSLEINEDHYPLFKAMGEISTRMCENFRVGIGEDTNSEIHVSRIHELCDFLEKSSSGITIYG